MQEDKEFFIFHIRNIFIKLSISLILSGIIAELILFFKPSFINFNHSLAPILGMLALINLMGFIRIFFNFDQFKHALASELYFIISSIINGLGFGSFAEALSIESIPAIFFILALQCTLFAFYIKRRKSHFFDKKGILALLTFGAIISFWYGFLVYNFDFRIMLISAIMPIILFIQRDSIEKEYYIFKTSEANMKNYEYAIVADLMGIALSIKLLGSKINSKKKHKNKI